VLRKKFHTARITKSITPKPDHHQDPDASSTECEARNHHPPRHQVSSGPPTNVCTLTQCQCQQRQGRHVTAHPSSPSTLEATSCASSTASNIAHTTMTNQLPRQPAATSTSCQPRWIQGVDAAMLTALSTSNPTSNSPTLPR